jgi:hypothetical protein
VTGKVTYKGQPVNEGQITFMSAMVTATGDLGEDGSYTLSYMGRSGIPVGGYKAYITPPRPTTTAGDEAAVPATVEHPMIPAKYQAAATTDLTATVKEGENTFPFDMQ